MTAKKVIRPRAAALAMLSGMAIIGVIDNFVVLIAADGGLWQFHFMRALMALPLIGLVALMTGLRLRPIRLRFVLLRSFFTASSMMFYFGSLAFLPLAQVLAGLFTAPIFVLLISVFVLGERIGLWRISAVVLGFAGALVVLKPETGMITWVSFVPIIAGAFYAVGAIGTRLWCEGESTLGLVAGFMVCLGVYGALGLCILTLFPQNVPFGADGFILRGWVMPTQSFFLLTLMQAVMSIIAVGLLTRAYQWGEASSVAAFEYSVMIFGPLTAWVLFEQGVTATMVGGIVAIILAGVIITLRSEQPSQ